MSLATTTTTASTSAAIRRSVRKMSDADINDDNKESRPTLPPLYLHDLETTNSKSETNCLLNPSNPENDNNDSSMSTMSSLPPELAMKCLFEYADWGDLAKLSCVQKSWRNVIHDSAAHGGSRSEWILANALLNGTNGLTRNPKVAIQYLEHLAGGETVNEDENKDECEIEDPADSENNTAVTDGNHAQTIAQQPETPEKSETTSPFLPAMRLLATCHLTGEGVDKNTNNGISWLERAALKGNDTGASHELGVIYEVGEHGVKVDIVAAAKWFQHGAERGNVESMAEYGMCCELGCGREQSDEEALQWYVKAANAGHAQANYSVGEYYEEARGVPQSDEEACLWYYKAAVVGDEDSKKALKRLRDIARIVLPGGWSAVLNE